MARLASVAGYWNGGGGGWRERRARQRLRRRQYWGRTVWLGQRRRASSWSCSTRVAVLRLVRWRLVAELLRPIRKALMEMAAAAGRREHLVALPQLSFPFVGTLALPSAVA